MSALSSKKSILLLDDDPEVIELITDILENENYQVISGSNGQDGLTKLQRQQFDLIITDVNMPRLNGIEFLKTLITEGLFKNYAMHIILITGGVDANVQLLCNKLNIPILEKPFDSDKLLELVQQGLTPEGTKKEKEESKDLKIAAGEVIVQEGNRLDGLFVIKSGTASILKKRYSGDKEYDEQEIMKIEGGAVMGYLTLIAGVDSPITIKADTECVLGPISKANAQKLIESCPKIIQVLIKQMAMKIVELYKKHGKVV